MFLPGGACLFVRREGSVAMTGALKLRVESLTRGIFFALLLTGSSCIDQQPVVYEKKSELFAIGSSLKDPRTLQVGYDELIDLTVGRVSKKAFTKYKNNVAAYVEARRSDARGKVFEAKSAYDANRLYKKIRDGDRVLTTAAEGDPSHPADNLLWRAGYIIGRYQLKSTKNSDSIVKFISDPKYISKYANEIIVTHPGTFLTVLSRLENKKLLGPLSVRWKRVDDAIEEGRLSNYIFPGHEVSSYDEAQKKADEVIRRQFEKARRRYGS